MDNLFYKNIEKNPFEFKEGTGKDSEFYFLKGYASTFGNVDRVGDIVAKGAFTKSLAERTPKMLSQHDTDDVIGGVDTIYETDSGLYFEARLPKDNSLVKDLVPLIKIGAIDSISIGFNTTISEWNEDTGIRTLKEVELWEISVVTFPANEKAKILGIKKLQDMKTKIDVDEKMIDAAKAESISTKREFEQVLKDTGLFTKKAIVVLASRFNEISQGDPVDLKSNQSDSDANDIEVLNEIEQLKKLFI